MDAFPLPAGWQWDGSWEVDVTEGIDAEGWMYGRRKTRAKITSTMRKRRWVRTRSVDMEYKILPSPKLQQRAGLDSVRETLVYLTVKAGRGLKSAEKPYLKMWVRRAEEKQQKQRTKVIKRDPNPQFGQTFFWCFVIGDFFVLRHYEWGSLRDAKLGSYEVNVMHLDFNGSEQWVPLSDQGGEVLLSWHLGQAPA
mmetsp:Transcript_2511/g.4634  ORF Transcript_2511/g.4634 Transcript_2511/m.4634 type:complete len:195 (+) Transcript_2511:112-696(+)